MNVLVVGGAGYIGSHCVRQLVAAGHNPVVLDNLVFGHRAAVSPDIPFYSVNLGNESEVGKILRKEKIDIVMHFAAYAYVGESVTDPMKYYFNNVAATLHLLRCMMGSGVKKFVFSSTCATYGIPEKMPLVETMPQAPINPYGQTKLDVENALKAFALAYGLSFAAFRYFNAAGAAEDGTIGEQHNPETHLIPLLIDAAVGRRENVNIFGTDYPTPDGTCLRDYVHVDDLSRAHIAVFDKLARHRALLQPRHRHAHLGPRSDRRRGESHRQESADRDRAAPRRRPARALRRLVESDQRTRLADQIQDYRAHRRHRLEMALRKPRRV